MAEGEAPGGREEGKRRKVGRWLRKLGHDWDRVTIYMFFVAIGVYSLFYPFISLARVAPSWIEIMLSVEFIVAGVSLTAGLHQRLRWMRSMGLTVSFLSLVTIAGVIAFAGGPPVMSYALMFGAFAMQAVVDLRGMKSREELEKEVQELMNSVLKDGEKP